MASFYTKNGKTRVHIRRKSLPKPITKLFNNEAEARIWAANKEAEISSGTFSDDSILKRTTVGDLIDRHIDEIDKIKPISKTKHGNLMRCKEGLGHIPLSTLSSVHIVEHCKRRREAITGATMRVELTFLSGVFKIAKSMWGIPWKVDPIADARPTLNLLNLTSSAKQRDRRPTSDELIDIERYFEYNPLVRIPMNAIISFAIDSCMRLGEIVRLRFNDIDHNKKTIIVRDRKHPTDKLGNNQVVPLLGRTYEIVCKQRELPGDLIFPYNPDSVGSAFAKACKRRKIVDLHFHDLRHEGVSRLFEQGYRIEQVSIVSGHRDWANLKRYTNIKPESLHPAVKM